MTTQRLLLVEPPDSSIPIAPEMRETFRVLDVVASSWIVVISYTTIAPPALPLQGDAYLVPAGATGAWAGHQDHLAIFTANGWIFRSPRYGWIVVVTDQNEPYGRVLQYSGTEWTGWILPASQVSFSTSGTDFVSTTLQTLMVEVNLRLIADETDIAANSLELVDHETRIAALEASSGGGGGSFDIHFNQNCELLLGFEGANAATTTTDESPAARAITFNGNAQISTAQAKWGSSSLKLDGTGDYLTCGTRTDLGVATKRLTIECWIRCDVNNRLMCIASKRVTPGQSEYSFFVDATGKLQLNVFSTAAAVVTLTGSTVLAINTWYHVAFSEHDDRWWIWLNGTSEGTAVESAPAASNTNLFHIGRDPTNTGRDFQGYIDEFRVSSYCRYVANFTVPTAAYPRTGS